MLIVTAGHIDHGKTTLVRALTGVDTDRLPEEKARGISIELGYAYSPLPNGEVLGIVDVPGHERFVRTMIAGAWGVDFALLVVAADDGLMPQTREHIEILDLLGISRGAVAITKTDRVDVARANEVRAEATAALGTTTLAGAPVFAVNASVAADADVERLRAYLHEVGTHPAACGTEDGSEVRSEGLFRLAVDRVFTLPGQGTVVTGTAIAGRVHAGDMLLLMPSGQAARVRSLHVQGRTAECGSAGQRCALSLPGIDARSVSRGDWVADSRALVVTDRVDVRACLLPHKGLELRAWTPVHVHAGTAHVPAHAVPLSCDTVGPGRSAHVQLVMDRPICLVPGDRLILRDARAARTLGGATALDPSAPARKRRSSERERYLGAIERSLGGGDLAPLLERSPHGISLTELSRLTSLVPERIKLPPGAFMVPGTADPIVMHRAVWDELKQRTVGALRRFHEDAADEPGADVGRLRRMTEPSAPLAIWRPLVEELIQQRMLARNGSWLHLPGHVIALSSADQKLADQLMPLIVAGRVDPPWVRELAVSVGEPEDRVRAVLRKQLRMGGVQQVVHDLYYAASVIQELADRVSELASAREGVGAAAFRDAIGIGRKRAIQILEYFDRVGHTRRVRDRHLLREDSGWSPAQSRFTERKVHAPGGATGLQTLEGAPDASW
jgi:selenocysteine-specific elongation factor